MSNHILKNLATLITTAAVSSYAYCAVPRSAPEGDEIIIQQQTPTQAKELDEEIKAFYYPAQSKPEQIDQLIDNLYNSVKLKAGEKASKAVLEAWIKVNLGYSDINLATLMYNTKKGFHFEDSDDYLTLEDLVKAPASEINIPSVDIRLPGVPPRESKKAGEEKKTTGKYFGEIFGIGPGYESAKVNKGYPMIVGSLGLGKNWYLNAGAGARCSSSEMPPETKTGIRFDAYGTESSREDEAISFIGLDKRFGESSGESGVYFSLGADLYQDNTTINKSIDERILDKSGNVIARNTNYPRYEYNKCDVKGKFGVGVNSKNVAMEMYAKGREGETIIGLNVRYCPRSNTKQ